MSLSEYSLKIRLSKVLESHLRSLAGTYQISLNDAVKMVLTQHHLEYGNKVLTPPSDPKPRRKPKPKVTPHSDVTVDPKEKQKGENSLTPYSDVTPDPTTYSPNNPNVFKIINNNICCTDPNLQKAWEAYVLFRKEKRKKLVPSQLEYIAKQFDKVIDAEGVEGLKNRLNRSVVNGWVGFVFPNEELGAKSEQPNRSFSEDDI